jgi:glycosyltransferase involved in cell wall biosynthesis
VPTHEEATHALRRFLSPHTSHDVKQPIAEPPRTLRPDHPSIRLGYVAGALRVTLDPASESTGPRAHVSGFLSGLSACGVTPRIYLAGHDVPKMTASKGSGERMGKSYSRRLALDAARLALRPAIAKRARSVLGQADIVYERQATFQSLGRQFQRRGSWWVLESNGPFWYEAKVERSSLALAALARRIEVEAYRDADLVVAVSEPLKAILQREAELADEQILVLPNGVDTARFDPSRVEPMRHSEKPVIGWVGYLTEWAGVSDLIEATRLLDDTGREFKVVIVGDGPARAAVTRQISEAGLGHRVQLVGHVRWDRVPELVAGFDLAFSGQRSMAIGAMYHSPQKLYEYQAMGKPVIASDFPDARSVVDADFSGWLFAPGDVGDLAAKLDAAMDAPDLRSRAVPIREAIVRRHSWTNRVRTLLEELDQRGMMSGARR